jgi:hypothetical protein
LPHVARDMEPLAPAEDVARLDKWLDHLSGTARRNRITSGATTLVLSGLILGTGIPAFLRSDPADELTRGAGFVAVAGSGVLMAAGIVQLAVKSPSESTLERWGAATEGELTLRELARFEGELRQYSESTRRAVRVLRWTYLGLALTGGLILGLTPAADLSTDGATTGYVTGGAMLGVGLLGFGLTFARPSRVDYWEAYRQGKSPKPTRWSASPRAGRHVAGLAITGLF